jgi:hypothetical protein
VAVATHPAPDVAANGLARHLDAGLRDLVHFTDPGDRVSADDLWDTVIAIEPAPDGDTNGPALTRANFMLEAVGMRE